MSQVSASQLDDDEVLDARFAELLKPIKDLNKNFQVNIYSK